MIKTTLYDKKQIDCPKDQSPVGFCICFLCYHSAYYYISLIRKSQRAPFVKNVDLLQNPFILKEIQKDKQLELYEIFG